MRKGQILILVALSMIALTVFAVTGLLFVIYGFSGRAPQKSEAIVMDNPSLDQTESVTVQPASPPVPIPTRVRLELPTAVPKSAPTPTPTRVILSVEVDPTSVESETSEPSFTDSLSQFIADQQPVPREPANSTNQTQLSEQQTESPAPDPSSSRPPASNIMLPIGEWEYFASDGWGSAVDFIKIEIHPEDAKLGLISVLGTTYGVSSNPCKAYFFQIPVEQEEGELQFKQFTDYGSVVGGFKEGNYKISVLARDYACTGEVFGILDKVQ